MKYINLRMSPINNYVETTRVCSHCGSVKELNGNENFCPMCGAKLKRLPGHLDKEAVTALVNENIDKLSKPLAVEHETYADDVEWEEEWDAVQSGSVSSGMQDSSGVRWETRMGSGEKPVEKKCLHGFKDDRHCGHCTSNGACTVTVLTSMPPKYNMCPFRGDGYIDCKDA